MVFAKTTLIKEYPMCHYQHLTLIEREKILFFRAQGKNLSVIAKALGRSKATISRELRRNGRDALYIPAISMVAGRNRRTFAFGKAWCIHQLRYDLPGNLCRAV